MVVQPHVQVRRVGKEFRPKFMAKESLFVNEKYHRTSLFGWGSIRCSTGTGSPHHRNLSRGPSRS